MRFRTARRDSGRFNLLNARMMAGESLSDEEEHDFFANMVHSPALLKHLAAHPEEGPFFFIPYLFTTSVLGPLIHPARSVLVPCLHDEGYARMKAVRRAFESARAVVFHVPAERELAASLYDLSRGEPLVLGEGIDTGWSADAGRFRRKYGLDGPFILYAGRKDAGKNTPLLLQYFLRYLADRGGARRPPAGAHRRHVRRDPPGRARSGDRPGFRRSPGQIRRLRRRRSLRAAFADGEFLHRHHGGLAGRHAGAGPLGLRGHPRARRGRERAVCTSPTTRTSPSAWTSCSPAPISGRAWPPPAGSTCWPITPGRG